MTRACLTIYKILHSTLPLLFIFIVVFLFCNSQIRCFLNVSVSFAWVQFAVQAVCVERHLGANIADCNMLLLLVELILFVFFSSSKKAFWVMSSCSNHTNNKHKQLNTNNIAFIIDGIPLPLMLRVCVCVSCEKGCSWATQFILIDPLYFANEWTNERWTHDRASFYLPSHCYCHCQQHPISIQSY